MAERKPVVLVGGQLTELPAGDMLPPQTPAAHDHAQSDVTDLPAALAAKQNTLVSGTNIKTVGSKSIVGGGDAGVTAADVGAAPASAAYIPAGTTNTLDLDSINKRVPITANTTLPENGTVAYTLGSAFILECGGTACTISRGGSDTITIDGKSGTVTSFTLKANTSVAMVRTSTTTWRAYGDI